VSCYKNKECRWTDIVMFQIEIPNFLPIVMAVYTSFITYTIFLYWISKLFLYIISIIYLLMINF